MEQDSQKSANDVLHKVLDRHKTIMKEKYETILERLNTPESKTSMYNIYPELYITEKKQSEGMSEEHEVQVEKIPRKHLQHTLINWADIFKSLQDNGAEKEKKNVTAVMDESLQEKNNDKGIKVQKLRSVMTKGIAGIGKTVSVQKYVLDWAEGKANQDVGFMFVLPFRELNLIKDDQYSLHELLCAFHPELKEMDPNMYDGHKAVFILDGLDESRIQLNFSNCETVSNTNMISSVGVLMSNLIKGELLPSALIWVTSRPAAANQISSQYINRVTKIEGFSDPQRKEYFRNRIHHRKETGQKNSFLQSVNCPLKELDLSNIRIQDSEVETLSCGLKSSHCKLESLRLAICNLGEKACESLGSALQSVNSSLKELDLSYNVLQDPGIEMLSAGLKSSYCKLERLRLAFCNVGGKACENLGSLLQSENSSLTKLDLCNNDLQDFGVGLLSAGQDNSHCKLETLKLSGCMVTEKGCSFLASALKSNLSHLKELDLTYNHPGESGVKLLSALLKDPNCTLQNLQVEHGGKIWMKPGLKKYACELTLDPNTAYDSLYLSEENKKVECDYNKYQTHPDHPERFDGRKQVLCVESLTGRCYWEVTWDGRGAAIVMTYKGIQRKGYDLDCLFGARNQSWSLEGNINNDYTFWHNCHHTFISAPVPLSRRVGVYLDWVAGTLSFYNISPHSHLPIHLHTVNYTFTEPLTAGFRVRSNSSVCLSNTD